MRKLTRYKFPALVSFVSKPSRIFPGAGEERGNPAASLVHAILRLPVRAAVCRHVLSPLQSLQPTLPVLLFLRTPLFRRVFRGLTSTRRCRPPPQGGGQAPDVTRRAPPARPPALWRPPSQSLSESRAVRVRGRREFQHKKIGKILEVSCIFHVCLQGGSARCSAALGEQQRVNSRAISACRISSETRVDPGGAVAGVCRAEGISTKFVRMATPNNRLASATLHGAFWRETAWGATSWHFQNHQKPGDDFSPTCVCCGGSTGLYFCNGHCCCGCCCWSVCFKPVFVAFTSRGSPDLLSHAFVSNLDQNNDERRQSFAHSDSFRSGHGSTTLQRDTK